MACGIIKRRASLVMMGWNDDVRDTLLWRMMFETVNAVKQDNPAHGDWCVDGWELNVRVDDSSLATGVMLERHGTVLEDACLL